MLSWIASNTQEKKHDRVTKITIKHTINISTLLSTVKLSFYFYISTPVVVVIVVNVFESRHR